MNEDMVQSHMKLLEGCDYQWVKISTLDQDLNILDCMGWQMKVYTSFIESLNDLEDVVLLKDLEKLLKDLGILDYFQKGNTKSPPLRIPYRLLQEKLPDILKKDE